MSLRITESIDETRVARLAFDGNVAFVPTMGALHEGHLSLMRRARELADHVVVSIFVNPTQFAPHEDLDRYPRPFERDVEFCRNEGVELIFHPMVDAMYPPNEPDVVVDVPALTTTLEGEHRPGHFVGVCRVVAKLLSIVEPDVACFGRKDYQQLRVIEAMTAGLCLPVRIEACDTVREPDGLALSSRNVYLDDDQRARALSINRALRDAVAAIEGGASDVASVEAAMRRTIADAGLDVEYAVVRHPQTLAKIDRVSGRAVCLVAARIGSVRLIDNMLAG